MKLRLAVLLVAGAVLASCGRPALLVLDPSSAQLYSLEGSDDAGFRKAADQAGFRLEILRLDAARPLAEQIDQSLGRAAEGTPVVFPPLLETARLHGAEAYPKLRALALDAVVIDRGDAFADLGKAAAQWVGSVPAGQIWLLTDRVDGAAAGERQAFTDALGPDQRFELRTLPVSNGPEREALARDAVREALAAGPALVVADAGDADRLIAEAVLTASGNNLVVSCSGLLSGEADPGLAGCLGIEASHKLGVVLAATSGTVDGPVRARAVFRPGAALRASAR